MTKARDLADLIAAGSVLADGTVEAADISDVTATAAELNLLDGVTATTAELNYVDGVTSAIQTQIDTKAPTASPTFTGTITFPAGQTFDGRDVSADGTKLDGIEASADVTDTTNVSAAGALMKSGGTMTGAITFAAGQTFDGRDVSADGSKLDGIESTLSGTYNITGNLGVGISSPSNPLEVIGSVDTNVATFSTLGDGGGASNRGISIATDTYGGSIRTVGSGVSMGFDVNGSERMRIDSSGNVGIGRTDPADGKFGDGSSAFVTSGNATTIGSTHFATNSDDSSFIGMWSGHSSANPALAVKNTKALTFGNWSSLNGVGGFTERMRIDTSGNVGIGTSSPNSYSNVTALTINGTNASRTDFEAGGTLRGSVYATNSNQIGFLDAGQAYAYRHEYNTSHHWLIANQEFMQLNNDGLFLADGNLKEDYDALSGTTPNCNSNSGGAFSLTIFSLTMTGNTTFTFSAGHSGYSQGFVLQLTGNGGTVTWPASVDWAGGTAPDAPASGETDLLVFWTRDGGTTWYGMLAIDAAA
jgi:hypothetical protein